MPLARLPIAGRDMKWFLVCLAAGLASACGFAPLNLWPLTLLGVAALLWAVERAPSLRSALAARLVVRARPVRARPQLDRHRLHLSGGMPAWLGWVAVVLLSLYLAVYPAVGGRPRLALGPAATGCGWSCSSPRPGSSPNGCARTLFTGFAWNPLGVTLLLDRRSRRSPRWSAPTACRRWRSWSAAALLLLARRGLAARPACLAGAPSRSLGRSPLRSPRRRRRRGEGRRSASSSPISARTRRWTGYGLASCSSWRGSSGSARRHASRGCCSGPKTAIARFSLDEEPARAPLSRSARWLGAAATCC